MKVGFFLPATAALGGSFSRIASMFPLSTLAEKGMMQIEKAG
jgi:hypothetical protein